MGKPNFNPYGMDPGYRYLDDPNDEAERQRKERQDKRTQERRKRERRERKSGRSNV
ncbi:MAG: hypothetical protein LUC41_01305 [Clostridiales bacterium]|nr:hypothetical protein [Clostridiales bacterium]